MRGLLRWGTWGRWVWWFWSKFFSAIRGFQKSLRCTFSGRFKISLCTRRRGRCLRRQTWRRWIIRRARGMGPACGGVHSMRGLRAIRGPPSPSFRSRPPRANLGRPPRTLSLFTKWRGPPPAGPSGPLGGSIPPRGPPSSPRLIAWPSPSTPWSWRTSSRS